MSERREGCGVFEARRARLRERREAVEVEPRHVSELGCRRRHGEGEAQCRDVAEARRGRVADGEEEVAG